MTTQLAAHSGDLVIQTAEVRGLPDRALTGGIEPVLVLQLGAHRRVTERCQRPAGPNALFGDEFVIPLDTSAHELQISVYDQSGPEHGKFGEYLASGQVRLCDLMDSTLPIERWVPLSSPHGESGGRARMLTTFIPRTVSTSSVPTDRPLSLRIAVPSGRDTTIKTTHGATVDSLHVLLEQTTGIPVRLQLLSLGRTMLERGSRVFEYGLTSDDLLTLSLIEDTSLLPEAQTIDKRRMTDRELSSAEIIEARVVEGKNIATLPGVDFGTERPLRATIQLGEQVRSTKVTKTRDGNPKWKDTVVLQLGRNSMLDSEMTLCVMNTGKAGSMVVGTGTVDLSQIVHQALPKGKLEQWIVLRNSDRMMGMVLITVGFVPAPKDVVLMASERRERAQKSKPSSLNILLPDMRTIPIKVLLSDTVDALMTILEQRTAIPSMQQCLSFGRRVLNRGVRLERFGISDGDQIRLQRSTARPLPDDKLSAPLLEGGVEGGRLIIKVCHATQLNAGSVSTVSWLESAGSFYVECAILSQFKRTKLALSGVQTMQPVWNQEVVLELRHGDEHRDCAVRLFSSQGNSLQSGVHGSSIGQLMQISSMLRCLAPTERWLALCDSDGDVCGHLLLQISFAPRPSQQYLANSQRDLHTYQLIVLSPTSRLVTVTVNNTDPVSVVQKSLYKQLGVEPKLQKLMFGKMVLAPEGTLGAQGVQPGDQLRLMVEDPFKSALGLGAWSALGIGEPTIQELQPELWEAPASTTSMKKRSDPDNSKQRAAALARALEEVEATKRLAASQAVQAAQAESVARSEDEERAQTAGEAAEIDAVDSQEAVKAELKCLRRHLQQVQSELLSLPRNERQGLKGKLTELEALQELLESRLQPHPVPRPVQPLEERVEQLEEERRGQQREEEEVGVQEADVEPARELDSTARDRVSFVIDEMREYETAEEWGPVSLDRVLYPEQSWEDNLVCRMCGLLLHSPHTMPCLKEHLICNNCLCSHNSGDPCPLCLMDPQLHAHAPPMHRDQIRPSIPMVQKMLQQTKVRCVYYKQGCSWIGRLADASKHYTGSDKAHWKCLHRSAKCPFSAVGCNAKIRSDKLAYQAHMLDSLSLHTNLLAKELVLMHQDHMLNVHSVVRAQHREQQALKTELRGQLSVLR